MAYIAVMSVVAGSAAVSYVHIQKNLKLQDSYLYDIERGFRFGQKFKRAVRESDSVPASYGKFKTGDSVLILSGKNTGTVIFCLEDGSLYRYTAAASGKKPGCRILCMDRIKRIRFSAGEPGRNPVITMEIQLEARTESMNVKPLFVFSEQVGLGGRYVIK